MAIGTTAAIIGASAIGAGATALSANRAAKATSSAANQADATQRYIFDQQREDNQPWLGAGQNALAALQFELGLGERPRFNAAALPEIQTIQGAPSWSGKPHTIWTGEGGIEVPTGEFVPGRDTFRVGGRDFNTMQEAQAFAKQQAAAQPGMAYGGFKATPGYAFRVGEGTKAIERSAAARGGLNSGATLKALNQFGQNIAADEYGTYLNRLGAMSGVGQVAQGQNAAIGQSFANATSQNALIAGQGRASAYQQTGQAINNFGQNTLGALAYGGYLGPRPWGPGPQIN